MRCKLTGMCTLYTTKETRVNEMSQRMMSDGVLMEVRGTSKKHYKADHKTREKDGTSTKDT